VPINEKVLTLLREKVSSRKNSGYVFPSEAGTMIEGHNLSRAYRLAKERAGLNDVRFHDLRHTAGSRMVQAGVDLYSVSLILGHKTLAVTKRYAHHNVESLRRGVSALVSGHV
jgi:integrase